MHPAICFQDRARTDEQAIEERERKSEAAAMRVEKRTKAWIQFHFHLWGLYERDIVYYKTCNIPSFTARKFSFFISAHERTASLLAATLFDCICGWEKHPVSLFVDFLFM